MLARIRGDNMNMQEITDIVEWMAKSDLSVLDTEDSIKMVCAYETFAESIKPIMIKYSTLSNQSFICRL